MNIVANTNVNHKELKGKKEKGKRKKTGPLANTRGSAGRHKTEPQA